MATATTAHLAAALEGFAGDVLLPDSNGYDDARRVHNGMIDKRPGLIARCRGVADVVAAVNLAREEGLEVSIRGGGHNVAGKAVTDGGVMIDLSAMRGIHVDPARRVARAQGGATWADLNRETQLHGLAVTGGVVSTTGIGGLTLGGGLGWTMAKHGLAIDNLLSVEIVLADGRVLTASEDENADLFWAVRGGGGNFGVVTWFEYSLHPVGPTVTAGMIVHPFEAATDLLQLFAGLAPDLPDELTIFPALVHAPDGSGAPLAAMVLCHVGTQEQAAADLEPILGFGTPLDTPVGPMPYTAANALIDGAFPRGALNYWKASFLSDLTDEVIATMIGQFERCPSPMSALVLEYWTGASTRVAVDATAFAHREPGHNLVIASVWTDPTTSDDNVAWARETYDAVQPHFATRRYVNYLEDEAAEAQIRDAYGPNYERLAELKAKYDPANLFHLNQNIPPKVA
jgi:FAD/FMN-containing dehydrogenase